MCRKPRPARYTFYRNCSANRTFASVSGDDNFGRGVVHKSFLAGLAISTFLAATANAQGLEGKFRGLYVCGKLPTTRDILRVPIDLIVHGDSAEFARPLFNLNGTRVLGSELAAGAIDQKGVLHLSSTWSYLGNTAEANYTGTLTPAGGTLTGTQSWSGPNGITPVDRTCVAALVRVPDGARGSQAGDASGGTDTEENQ